MRSVAVTLLLLMLPGLLLPAGASMRVCLCGLFGVAADRLCCASRRGVPPDTPPRCPHCSLQDTSRERTPQGQLDPAGDCHCVTFIIPDDGPEVAPLPPQHAVPTANALPQPVVLAPAVPVIAARAWPPAEVRPPPPGRHRNLPLRL